MESDMNQLLDKVLPRLDSLTAKLGQGGSWAYQLALKQVYISYSLELFFSLMFFGAAAFGLKKVIGYVADNDNGDGWNDGGPIAGAVCSGIGMLVGIAMFSDALEALLNPPYWALMDLISRLAGK